MIQVVRTVLFCHCYFKCTEHTRRKNGSPHPTCWFFPSLSRYERQHHRLWRFPVLVWKLGRSGFQLTWNTDLHGNDCSVRCIKNCAVNPTCFCCSCFILASSFTLISPRTTFSIKMLFIKLCLWCKISLSFSLIPSFQS